MAQDYFTLDEAARIVNISQEELKQMARRGELRSFQDRGTWRFRAKDIQELARRRGMTSDPELALGEAPVPRPADSPAPRSPGAPKSREAEVFDFSLDAGDDIGVGHEDFSIELPGSSKRNQPPSSRRYKDGPRSPAPRPGSDSDVRLIAEGSDMQLQIPTDSDSKIVDEAPPPGQVKQRPRGRAGTGPDSPPPRGRPASKVDLPKNKTSSKLDVGRKSGLHPPASVDSGARLVPMESDSDVRIVGAGDESLGLGAEPPRSSADSDVRLERQAKAPPASDQGLPTEEINLDEEIRHHEASRSPQAKVRPRPSNPVLPAISPFELSDADVNLPATPRKKKSEIDSSSDFELTPAGQSSSPLEPGSSDFDLSPVGESSSPLDSSSEDEFRLELPEDEVALGGPPTGAKRGGPASGISLENPADSGISLEQGGEGSDEIEFTLSLNEGGTPRPAGAGSTDSDSEFELTLDADSSSPAESDSEFELTLDEPRLTSDSDSEFELTLDDAGGLSPLEAQAPKQAKAPAGEKDIFETDFDVPGLEEESGSEAVALDADTGLESSEFDLDLDDEEMAVEDGSGSEVVALDDEADDASATVQAPGRKKRPMVVAEEDEEGPSDFEQLEGELGEEGYEEGYEEEVGSVVVKEKLIPAAPWGAMPVLFMLPCVLIMFVVAIMGFEMVQSLSGYKGPGLFTRTIGGIFDSSLKK
ncbi:MAG: helix-turn-helix domain-containing protein [Gemmataceae bacterium]|nr:helix-turn-helix domain-containing protein [Gemmataceae bacterium]